MKNEKLEVIVRQPNDYPRGKNFEKIVSSLETIDELMNFYFSHWFVENEIVFFVKKLSFVCNNLSEITICDSDFDRLNIFFPVLLIAIKGKEYEKKIMDVISKYEIWMNVLIEDKIDKANNRQELYEIFQLHMALQQRVKVIDLMQKKGKRALSFYLELFYNILLFIRKIVII